MHEVIPVIMREFAKRQKDELCTGEITLPQFVILDFLHREGELRMTDVARLMEVTTAGATGIVNRLVKYGYVIRIFDPSDRRIIKVKLTSKGAELVGKILRHRRKMIIKIFGKITQSEREDYLKILMRIRDVLTK
jgi:DNA-binding MarR family transcriptional regulator